MANKTTGCSDGCGAATEAHCWNQSEWFMEPGTLVAFQDAGRSCVGYVYSHAPSGRAANVVAIAVDVDRPFHGDTILRVLPFAALTVLAPKPASKAPLADAAGDSAAAHVDARLGSLLSGRLGKVPPDARHALLIVLCAIEECLGVNLGDVMRMVTKDDMTRAVERATEGNQ